MTIATGLVACGVEYTAPTDSARDRAEPYWERADAGTFPLRTLSVSPTSLNLVAGERMTVLSIVRDSKGEPVPDVTVSFAVVGVGSDTSLAAVSVGTNTKGQAENTVQAGDLGANFELRISALGAEAAFVPVHVSPAGFGTLAVSAPYAGQYTPEVRSVLVYEGRRCADLSDLAPTELSTGETNLGPDTDEAQFFLPAGNSYAVVGQALGPEDGALLATGCVDGATIETDTVKSISLEFVDSPLRAVGVFDVDIALDGAPAGVEVAELVEGAVQMRVAAEAATYVGASATENHEALYLLQALEKTLSGNPAMAPAGPPPMLATPENIDALRRALSDAATGPMAAASAMANAAATSVNAVTLSGQIVLESGGGKLNVSWAPRSIAGHGDGATEPRLPLNNGPVKLALDLWKGPNALLDLGQVAVPLPLTLLANQGLRAFAGSGDTPTISERLGCTELAAFWTNRPLELVAAECDNACLAAACDRALAGMLTATDGALAPDDTSDGRYPMDGALGLAFLVQDRTGDLLPDSLTADDLACAWTAPSGTPVTLSANANGVPEVPLD